MFNIGGFNSGGADNSNVMQELIDRLKSDVGLTDAQAQQSITVIKDFAKQKLPMFAGSIESMFNKYSSKKQDDDFLD